MYVVIVALILFINYSIYRYQEIYYSKAHACQSIFCQFLTFQVLILVFLGAFNSYSAISAEVAGNSYDFFRMLPLGAYQKATGILLGKNLVVLLFSAINFIFLLLFGIFGRVNIVLQLQLVVLLVSLALLANLTALLSSTYSLKGKRKSSPVVMVLLFALFVVPQIAHGVYLLFLKVEEVQASLIPFFNIKIPILLLISLIALYLSIWAIKGVARKFNREREPLFTRSGAMLFLLGFEIIMLGLFSPHFLGTRESAVFFWLVTLLPILPVLLGSLRSYDNYIEVCRPNKIHDMSNIGRIVFAMLDSNVSLGIGLLLIWTAFCIGTVIWQGFMLIPILANIVILFSFLMVFVLLAELWVVFKPFYNKIGLLTIFFAGLYLILPLALGAVMKEDAIFRYCLIGYFGEAIVDNNLAHIIDMSVLLVNVLFCGLLELLILRQYAGIVMVRQRM
jgi:hypothetical protein